MKLEKYSIGMGDRFGLQGKAQLNALINAKNAGVNVVPVWNKSHREHTIIGSSPEDVRNEADTAVKNLDWNDSYYVDADHISLKNVDLFIDSSDFFTLDVADFTGQCADSNDINAFVAKNINYTGALSIPGVNEKFEINEQVIRTIAEKYLLAVKEAGKIYRHIENKKGTGKFITEVSMDETDHPQTPIELFFISSAIADEKIPAQTIAPKFTGRFNKGVDYVGPVNQFVKEFEEDICIIKFAIEKFGLPENLKLSLHSGSDKFSIYQPINMIIKKHGCGLHLKTAGTTWLEELIGLAMAENQGMEICREIYKNALLRFDELCAPYSTVIDINKNNLPSADEVAAWSGDQYANGLRHDQSHKDFNPDFRQLLHVGYKVAAELGEGYLGVLGEYEGIIAENVTDNIYDRHIKPVFFAQE